MRRALQGLDQARAADRTQDAVYESTRNDTCLHLVPKWQSSASKMDRTEDSKHVSSAKERKQHRDVAESFC